MNALRPIQRSRHPTGPPIRVKRTAVALMLLSLTTGLALPGDLSNRTTSASAMGWVKTAPLNTARYAHTATLLESGKLLVTGGAVGTYCFLCRNDPCSRNESSAELYDSATVRWVYTGSLNTARREHTATLLENGQVLVAGGYGDVSTEYPPGSLPLTSAELYDPTTGIWRLTGSFNTIQGPHSATRLANGRVLAVSKPNDGSPFRAELYDPATGTWSNTNPPSIIDHYSIAITLLPNGKVLAVSGNSAALYDPTTETWSRAGNLNEIRFSPHTMTLLRNGKVLVTGLVVESPASRHAELYDLNTGVWSTTGSSNLVRRNFENPTATLLPNDQVLFAGGYTSDPNSRGDELYDPATEIWRPTTGLADARHNYHSATLMPDGRVLVVGGTDMGTDQALAPYSSAELYGPEAPPKITHAVVKGKKLFVFGENFDPGAVILLNGKEQNTRQRADSMTTLIGKKTGKKIRAGDTLQVRNSNGSLSGEFIFTEGNQAFGGGSAPRRRLSKESQLESQNSE